ncbi:MAG: VCBS repeat-containing protein, partial [Candidatus Poribacteria bacterium]|nr:VCBS repeat-containing protein [Candidatus Poribacteria bacterium]
MRQFFAEGQRPPSSQRWWEVCVRVQTVGWIAVVLVCSPIRADLAESPITFAEVAEASGIVWTHRPNMIDGSHVIEQMGSGAALFDYDNDGWLDLFIVQSGILGEDGSSPPGSVLYRNMGDGRFLDVTAGAGVENRGGCGMGVAVGDIDNDGYADLYVTNYGPNRLYRNKGDGAFEDVTDKARVGDDRWGTSAAFLDYDLDGDLDLYVVNFLDCPHVIPDCLNDGVPASDKPCSQPTSSGARDTLYRNNGDGTFEDVSDAAGIAVDLPEARGLGVAIGDYDNDALPDIFVANDTRRNFLFRNKGDGAFEEIGLFAGVGYSHDGVAQGSMGADFGDLNRDGWLDLFVTNFSDETNNLYLNRGGLFFEDAIHDAGIGAASWVMSGFGTKFVDLDNDSDLDLLISNGHIEEDIAERHDTLTYAQPPQVFRNRGDGTFEDVSRLSGDYFHRNYAGRG